MRVFINGFGRIGRSVLRALMRERAQRGGRWPGLEIVGINDIAKAEISAYLFAWDSVFGPWPGEARLEGTALVIDGVAIPLHHEADLSRLDLSGVDVVMECTGRADTAEIAGRGLVAGARRVLISGPSKAAELTVVLGANEERLGAQRIVSNASCTTNALAPLLRLIDRDWGVVTGSMTTVHCYTGSQPTVDAPAGDFARSRAAGGVIGATDLPLVSSDLRARPESVVMATRETRGTGGGLLRVFGWYDNEWGFSNRMLDVTCRMA